MIPSLLLGCTMPIWVSLLGYHIMMWDLLLAIILTAGCFALELRRRSFRWIIFYGLALALQPGWGFLKEALGDQSLHARADCFYGPRAASIQLLAITIALLVIVWRRSAITTLVISL